MNNVMNTRVVSLVGLVCQSKREVNSVYRIVHSHQFGFVCYVFHVEVAFFVLWLGGAPDGEVGTLQHLQPLLLGLGNPVHGGEECDVWLQQEICNKTERQMLVK